MYKIARRAEDYVDAFIAEFGHAPDLDDTSDAEHATTAIVESTIPSEVTWEAWRAALCVELQARESAKLCLENGWDPGGDKYDLTAMSGDRQALDDRLARKSTSEEQRNLEARIRELIAVAA